MIESASKFEANLQMTLAPRAYQDVSGTTPPTYNYNIYFYAVLSVLLIEFIPSPKMHRL